MAARIEVASDGTVARVTVCNAAKLNVIGSALIREVTDAFVALSADAALRAVVLTGEGSRAFIGGADIREMAGLDPESGRAFITLLHGACAAIRACPVPVIASMHGYTLGAGLEIAASCDLRIAGAGGKFGMPEVRIGIPSVIEAALLPQLIGWGRTRWLLLTGETIDAAQALAWGLVEQVVLEDALDTAVERVLTDILACGPNAVRLQKRLIREWEELALHAAVERGIDCFAEAWRSEEPKVRMWTFLEAKRQR
jgi:enoyl-CoA hydratase/carnithine racemase